jgi:ankyrin repeat protein
LRHFNYRFLALLPAFAAVTSSALANDDVPVNSRLLVFARNSDAAGVERSLKEGANVNSRNRIGETALVIALKKEEPKKDDLRIAQLMLDAGTDVNLAAVNGITPLMAAAYSGRTEIAAQLLAKGASVGAVDRLMKNAMIYAAGEGRTEVVKLFLDRGVNPNALYEHELTALMWAAGGGHTETVRLLLDAGAKTELKDDRGMTAAGIARELKFEDVARLIESPPAKTAAKGG